MSRSNVLEWESVGSPEFIARTLSPCETQTPPPRVAVSILRIRGFIGESILSLHFLDREIIEPERTENWTGRIVTGLALQSQFDGVFIVGAKIKPKRLQGRTLKSDCNRLSQDLLVAGCTVDGE